MGEGDLEEDDVVGEESYGVGVGGEDDLGVDDDDVLGEEGRLFMVLRLGGLEVCCQ